MQKEINHEISWTGETSPSWQSRLLVCLFRLFRIKQRKASLVAVKNRLSKLKLKPASYKPTGLGGGIEVILKHIDRWPVYYTASSTASNIDNYVVFLHGGGYIDEIVSAHWKIIGKITREAKVKCIVPIYPLAPKATANDVVPKMGALMLKLFEEIGSVKVSIVGNSAGAALALATSQWLRDRNFRQPDKLVLISAALNASYISPEQRIIGKEDPLLDIEGALYGASLYAGNLDLNHPFISPLNGDFKRLPPMLVFSGSLDFLYPNSIELKKKAELAGVTIDLQLKKGQPHNYPAYPTPEGREALKLIIDNVK